MSKVLKPAFKRRFTRVSLICGLVHTLSACQPPGLQAPLSPQPLENLQATRPYQLIAEIKDPRFLAVAEKRLGAKLIDQLKLQQHTYSLLQVNPEQVQRQPYELKQGNPSGWSSELAEHLAQDLWQHHGEMLHSLELNEVAELPETEPPREQTLNDLSFDRRSVLEGWWRKQSGVERAWQYSVGTGTRAAYLDVGFRADHPEWGQRLILNGQNNQTPEAKDDRNQLDLPKGDHGTASLLVGFAERDNHLPSVGVAPAAEMIPYVASSVWEAAKALLLASQQNPDVIGMNFAFQLYPDWQRYGDYRQYTLLKAVFDEISRTTQVPVVIPAHNYAEPIRGGVRDWLPVGWGDEYSNILPVGGVEVDAELKVKAWFNPGLLTNINARGSNYGNNMIWAPSTFLDIANPDPDNLTPGSMNGTSAACPFVTAAVALIKSRFPKMKAAELRQLLQESAQPVDASALLQHPGATVPFIQVDKALELAMRQAGQEPSRQRRQQWSGQLSRNGSARYLYSFKIEGKPYQVVPNLAALKTRFQPPGNVQLEGWLHAEQPDEIEPFLIRPLPP